MLICMISGQTPEAPPRLCPGGVCLTGQEDGTPLRQGHRAVNTRAQIPDVSARRQVDRRRGLWGSRGRWSMVRCGALP